MAIAGVTKPWNMAVDGAMAMTPTGATAEGAMGMLTGTGATTMHTIAASSRTAAMSAANSALSGAFAAKVLTGDIAGESAK
jgi:hypothetical protein